MDARLAALPATAEPRCRFGSSGTPRSTPEIRSLFWPGILGSTTATVLEKGIRVHHRRKFVQLRREAWGLLALVAGVDSACFAAAAEGRVVAWGSNDSGQIAVPADIGSVRRIGCGWSHSLAIRSDGTVRSWGSNFYGESNTPPGLGACVAVAGGANHSVGLIDSYGGWIGCWGSNVNGQCVVDGIDSVVSVAAGARHTVVARADGSIRAWGDNQYGQASPPAHLVDAVAVSAGEGHSVALRRGGQVSAWGWNYYDQCSVPVGLDRCVAIASGENHNIALRLDGTVACWGLNGNGQCVPPPSLSSVRQVAGGAGFSVSLLADGSVVAWGSAPAPPSGVGRLLAIAAGSSHVLGIECDSTLMRAASDELAPYSAMTPREWPVATGPVDPTRGATLTVRAVGDLGTSLKFLVVRAEGRLLGTIFGASSGSGYCTQDGSVASIPIDPTAFAELAADGQVDFSIAPSAGATSSGCASATLRASLSWHRPISDCNGNGNDDACEIAAGPAMSVDCNGNSVIDSCDLAAGTSADIDSDLMPDECQPDCNGNSVPDAWEIASGLSPDCNANGRPDACDLVAGGGSVDVGGNGVPDECEPDCNGNRVPDPFEISQSAALDCDSDGLIDACEVLADRYALVLGPGSAAAGMSVPGGIVAPVHVYPGRDSVILLEARGRIVAWGAPSSPSTQVPPDLGEVIAVSSATDMSPSCPEQRVGLRADGTLRVWGGACITIPDPVPTGVLALAKGVNGPFHAAILAGGRVVAWGPSLGVVHPASMSSGVSAIAKGGSVNNLILFAVTESGAIRSYGNNNSNAVLVPPAASQPAAAVAAGLGHGLALRLDGSVVAWGRGDEGQRDCPPGSFDSIDAIGNSSLGLRPDGTVEVWGQDAVSLRGSRGVPFAEARFGRSSTGTFIAGLALLRAEDCNIDGTLDACQVGAAGSDCDGDGVRDTCQVYDQPPLDCNADGILDSCQLKDGLDCDGNGRIDDCDIVDGAVDSDGDGRIDGCEIALGDFDLNGQIDGADLGGLLAVWGLVPPPYGDLDRDGKVDGADLALLLSAWGSVP